MKIQQQYRLKWLIDSIVILVDWKHYWWWWKLLRWRRKLWRRRWRDADDWYRQGVIPVKQHWYSAIVAAETEWRKIDGETIIQYWWWHWPMQWNCRAVLITACEEIDSSDAWRDSLVSQYWWLILTMMKIIVIWHCDCWRVLPVLTDWLLLLLLLRDYHCAGVPFIAFTLYHCCICNAPCWLAATVSLLPCCAIATVITQFYLIIVVVLFNCIIVTLFFFFWPVVLLIIETAIIEIYITLNYYIIILIVVR